MNGTGASEIDGVWELVRAEFGGAPAPELVVKNTTIELACGEYRVRFGGETADAGTIEFGEQLELNMMLLRGLEGPNSGRTIPCIYQRAGNRLRICYGLDGMAPTGFKTSDGEAKYLGLYRWKRDQP